jgi:AcrR family transcriptional regulator
MNGGRVIRRFSRLQSSAFCDFMASFAKRAASNQMGGWRPKFVGGRYGAQQSPGGSFVGIKERKAREREMRRQQIMVAAKRVFTQRGYEKSTMEDIAREAELSPGTIYLYFKSKDELYASLCLRVLRFIHVKVDHAVSDASLDYEAKQEALLKAIREVYDYDPLILNNMFHLQSSETLKSLSRELLDEINALSRSALQATAGMFAAGIEEKLVIDRHPTALADTLWALFSGIVLWEDSKKMINAERYDFSNTLTTAFELFARGLRKRQDGG